MYIDTSIIFKENGWKCALDSWYPNSQYYIWEPADKTTEDIYAFDFYHNNGGNSVKFMWADSLEEARKLDNESDSNPSFTFTTPEELLTLIKCIKQ